MPISCAADTTRYLAHGTATDYMFEKLKVPLPYTWEIFGDFQVDYHDCFKMFNPVTKAQFDVSLVANAAAACCRFNSMPGGWVSICADQKKAAPLLVLLWVM